MADVLLVVAGLIALLAGGNALVRSAGRLASSFGVSAMVVSLTVVAFGTSAPELLVSVSAAQRGASGLALGNVIGSNIANIGLILAVGALLSPIMVDWKLIKRETALLVFASFVVVVMALDGEISALDGGLLLAGFIAFTVISVLLAWRERSTLEPEIEEFAAAEGITPPAAINRLHEGGLLVVGLVLLALGAQWTVDGATAIAQLLGVSDLIIGVTVVALGTSLPELAATLVAAWRKEHDIVVGNIIGSNIANLLLILGITALVQPVPVAETALNLQFPVMLGFTLVLVVFLFDRVVQRREGALLILAYAVFIGVSFAG